VPDARHFAEDLEELKGRLLFMGGLAAKHVRAALDALVAGDRDLMHQVIASDHELNELQIEIDDRCFTLLALQQPVAVDLRFIVSATKITVDLERVGDLAVNIAEASERYIAHRPVKALVDLPRMGDIAQHMLATALGAFLTQNAALAEAVLVEDDRLDQLKDQVFRELLTYMLGDTRTIEPAIDLILISRHLERIGDHATNIAEDVIFIAEGRDVRHANASRVG
jgi:phosphate transport system protein